jgi:TRAP-type C4-dicarboxylate transport system substrate-binding protein
MRRFSWILVAAFFASLLFASRTARADDTLNLGTLAPESSPWGQVFKVWARKVEQNSNGSMHLNWSWGGTAGDEATMVNSMKSNQLDGAAITAVGLGAIYNDVLVFQLPGMFASWDKLGHARDAMKGRLESGFDAAGYKILGWGDVGAGKIMGDHVQIKGPHDLEGQKVFYITGDPIGPELWRHVNNVSPKALSVPEIFPNLSQHNINVINAPPLAAEQLQWASRVSDINTMTTGYGIGALVITKARYAGLGEDVRQVLADTGADAANRLTTRIRALDNAAFAHMKNTKTPYDPTAAEVADWNTLFGQVQQGLRGGANGFTPDLFDQVKGLSH